MLMGWPPCSFIVFKLDEEDAEERLLSQRHHRRGRRGRSPLEKQRIFCLWRSLSSALKKVLFGCTLSNIVY